ncbi:hypothetical protein ATI53_104610 [Salipiger aestuarii]|uniref:Uncharacterized protein n=1 Tax=Salipiger aestuarii TaxID=568098 RepID=A0A327XSE1_9RHOB|nr:hypothetical protein C357_21297 [Citreicella sp. 357]RAK11958.1 hypothetical protein ATI53_104610 [Salipiger aestuarii]
MIETLRRAIARSDGTLFQDMIGALCLVVILVGALHLPSF